MLIPWRTIVAGLVIVSAHYGLTSAFTPLGMREIEGEEDKIADVTIAVQALVQNGHLHIPAGRPKVCLDRFDADPSSRLISQPLRLLVQYTWVLRKFPHYLPRVAADKLLSYRTLAWVKPRVFECNTYSGTSCTR